MVGEVGSEDDEHGEIDRKYSNDDDSKDEEMEDIIEEEEDDDEEEEGEEEEDEEEEEEEEDDDEEEDTYVLDETSMVDATGREATTGGDDDEVELYIPLDLTMAPQSLDSTSDFQIVGLHTPRPLISLGSRVYEGEWEDLVGTNMLFSQDAELIATTRQQIKLHLGQLVRREEAEKVINSQGRLSGIDWSNAQKTRNRKATLLEKIVAIDRKKKEQAEQTPGS
ncbi:hypothetical protein BZA70DRAFT_296977 [Myxozyma melibiosi]|uniref:Transcription factor TFIIIC triple barrel domain-containing protein n=1 Tax=Myxozyma melibiosi TaxID=54550 RepID=A0ABR1F1D4_9ASCO